MIATERKVTFKQRLLEHCLEKQHNIFVDFRNRIETLLEPHSLGNEEEYDNTELSQESQRTEEVDALNRELRFALRELDTLERLRNDITDRTEVSAGAVVVTNHASFFISASLEQFEVDGKVFTGISTSSPLYLAMKGKKKGDTFSFSERLYTILDIY